MFSEFQVSFLEKNNEYRALVDAPPLTLNQELCEYAEMYADWLAQCDAKKLDYCDRDYNWHFFWPDHDDHEFIGENLYWRQLQSSDEIYPGSDVPEFWINEKITAPITFFSESSPCYCNYGPFESCEFDKQLAHRYYTERHYLQMIWSKSTELGVGEARNNERSYVVARYSNSTSLFEESTKLVRLWEKYPVLQSLCFIDFKMGYRAENEDIERIERRLSGLLNR